MIRYAFKTSSWHPTQTEWLRAASTVSREERERIAQFMFKRDSKQSMMGRLMMRTCFSEMTGEPPQSFTLSRDKSGKPYLVLPEVPASCTSPTDHCPATDLSCASPTDHSPATDLNCASSLDPSCASSPDLSTLSFNVSHAGDYAVFVGSNRGKVGVDVMKVELRRNTTVSQFFSHMTRQFTEHEWECINEPLSDDKRLLSFYRRWCLKESFVKCMGTGLAFGLKRIEFHIGNFTPDNTCTTTTVNIDGKRETDWLFHEVLLDNHFITTAINNYHSGDDGLSKHDKPVKILSFSDLKLNPEPYSDVEYFTKFDEKKECP